MSAPITIESLLQQDSELTSLPEIFIRVSDLLEDENTSSTQIGTVVETDPSLTTRILKMVNSAYYGFPHTIASIGQAISILGRDRLRQILIGAVLGGVFGNMKNQAFFMEDYWHHSVKTAILSRLLCKQSEISEQAESLFTAGLLHQIGRLILVQKLPDQALEIAHAVETGRENVYQAEKRILGFDHCELGAAFIEQWGLPELLVNIARYHVDPTQATDYQEEVRLVNLAKGVSFLIMPFELEDLNNALEEIPGWQSCGLDRHQISEACGEADELVYQVMESLGMVQMTIDLDDED